MEKGTRGPGVFAGWKTKLLHLLNFVCFVLLALFVTGRLTWAYRANAYEAREEVLGLHNIEGNIDVIAVGSSNLLRYFIPLNAYRDHGITSYNYATTVGELDLMQDYMEEASKYQSPQLYVVNAGCLLYLSDEVREIGLRNWSDSLEPWNPTRLRSVSRYLSARDCSCLDVLSYYFDLAKYHSSSGVLGRSEQYVLACDGYYNLDRGFFPCVELQPFDTPAVCDEVGELTEREARVLTELLDSCDRRGVPVLFMVNPFSITREDWLKLNAAEALIRARGYDFVNFNRYYGEIGLDFALDYSDKGHVNVFGAEKFTEYFANYLKEHYQLPDHRGEADYASWDADAAAFEQTMEQWRAITQANIQSTLAGRK